MINSKKIINMKQNVKTIDYEWLTRANGDAFRKVRRSENKIR